MVFREIDDILSELHCIAERYDAVRTVFFTDTEFNVPDSDHCRRLLVSLLEAGLNLRFRFSSQFLPRPFGANFAHLLAKAGFSVILTCDSFADPVSEKNRASFHL